MRYSEKETFNTCPFKYYLTYEKKLSDIVQNEKVHHRNWGRGIHAGLQAHYLGKSLKECEQAFLSEYPKNLDPSDRAKTVEHGLKVLKDYITYWKIQDENWRVLEVEYEGSIQLDEDDEEQHGLHIDLIAENLQGGGIYGWDHKTTGKTPSYSYWKHFELSGQVTRYAKYIKEKYGQCSGFIINNMTVGFRQKKYKDEPAGFWCKFERQIFNRLPQQIKFWEESDKDWLWMIEQCKSSGKWPKALNKGCAYCEFYDLCLASDDEQIRSHLYQIKDEANFMPEVEI